MLHNEIAFPPHEGLPWRPDPPDIDGFVEPEPGIASAMAQIESGYTHGSRFTYAGDSGIPAAVFQAVKHNSKNYLYLSFAARFDPSFDDLDFVMIVLRPDFNAAPSDADRRIVIHPVEKASNGATGGIGTMPGDVRHDRGAFGLKYYQRDTSSGSHPVWKPITKIQNFDVSVRSTNSGSALCWSVEIRIPTKKGTGTDQGGLDWVDLTPTIGFYYDISRFWTQAAIPYAYQAPWPFDELNPDANIIVDPWDNLEADWDPTTVGKGFILNPGDANPAKGVKFQFGNQGIGVLQGSAIGSTLDAHAGASNKLVARVVNTDAAAAPGVRALFRIADFGLPGAPDFTTSATWLPITDTPPQNNVVENPTAPPTSIPAGGAPTDLTMTWTMTPQDFTKYKNLWSDQCLWVQLDSASPVNFVENSVRRNLTVLTASQARHPARIQGRGFGKSKTGGGKHKILLHVVKIPLQVESYHGAATHGPSREEIWIRNNYSPLLLGMLPGNMLPRDDNGNGDGGGGGVIGWMTIVNAYQVTNKTITAGKKKHKVVLHGGSYAYVTGHILNVGETGLADVELSHKLELDKSLAPTGAALKYHGKGMYLVSVPEKGDVVITNVVTTGPSGFAEQDEPPIDTSPDDTDDDKQGCLSVLFAIPVIGPILRSILEPKP